MLCSVFVEEEKREFKWMTRQEERSRRQQNEYGGIWGWWNNHVRIVSCGQMLHGKWCGGKGIMRESEIWRLSCNRSLKCTIISSNIKIQSISLVIAKIWREIYEKGGSENRVKIWGYKVLVNVPVGLVPVESDHLFRDDSPHGMGGVLN